MPRRTRCNECEHARCAELPTALWALLLVDPRAAKAFIAAVVPPVLGAAVKLELGPCPVRMLKKGNSRQKPKGGF